MRELNLTMKPLAAALLALSLVTSSVAGLLAAPSVAAAQVKGHAAPKRGDYLPPDLLASGPNVDEKAAHLRRAPSGYGWFSLGRIYVLASVMTGLIVEVVTP
jgi:Ni/Co efflux regulator RcnB